MKKLFILFLSVIILQSCGSNTESLLIGKWKIDIQDVEKSLKEKKDKDKNAIMNIAEDLIGEGLKNAISGKIEFKADKTAELKLMGTNTSGKWELKEDENIKEVSINGGKVSLTFIISSISKDKLVLTKFRMSNINLGGTELILIPDEDK